MQMNYFSAQEFWRFMYKKYQKAVSVSLVASMLTLSACSTQGVIDGIDVMLGKKEVVSQTNEQALTPVVVQDASQTLTINENFSHGGYYYDKLSDVQKSIYIALYDTFVSYGKECHLGDNDAEQIAIVYKSIVFDHPEIFYIDGFQLEYFKSEIPYYIFKPNYTKTPDEIELTKDKIDVYVNTALCAINNNGDEYAILQQIYEYIITTTRYDMSAPDLSSIVSVMCNGRAVCEGYAKTTMYLLQQYGIQCTVVPGYIRKNGTAHLWNAAKINGQWYYIDTTWGDEDFENDRNAPEVRYDYLCVSEEYLAGSHQIDAFVDMPKCVSMDDNY